MGLANKIPDREFDGNLGLGQLNPFGVYVHVPFCAHACDFCAFYQVEPRKPDIDAYLDGIEREMQLVEHNEGCDTAFWGGGTPGLLTAADMARLGQAQIARFGAPRQEWTVELAPGSVTADRLTALRDLGVTRVSLGIQSLSPRLLEALGRRHSLPQIMRAWNLIDAAGFASRNLDLIFAIPGQSIEDWRRDIDEAAALQPDHISTYCLTFEEDTALFVRLSEGRISIEPERERIFYEAAWDRLEALGFAQYEISNFARPGHRCQHNVNTWRMHEWIGLGPSAASQCRRERASNIADLTAWIDGVNEGHRADTGVVPLTAVQLLEDALIFGLRMNEGVDLLDLARRFGRENVARFESAMTELVADGLARWPPGDVPRLALTHEGRLLADAVGATLLGAAESID